MRATKLTMLAALAKLSAGAYVLQDDYQPSNFFDDFAFFDGPDPSNAYVTYVDKAKALKDGLASNNNDFVYLGVDSQNVARGRGRESVRLETKKTYKHGLIVADISHMPDNVCGTWPAFWATGATWPDDGEFDIIEGVNKQNKNVVALHTTAGCKVEDNNKYSGQLVTKDCDVYSPNQPSNQGCLFRAPSATSYGNAFNSIGGGVYATEWTSDSISVWFFPRYQIPSDINSENPDPSKWARPIAHFTGCEFDKFFQEQRIIFNTAFCGDWAKATWNENGCAAQGETCEDYVKNNPWAFGEAYWSINYMRVFQNKKGDTTTTTTTSSTSTSSSTEAPTTTATTSSTEPPSTYEPTPSYPESSPVPTDYPQPSTDEPSVPSATYPETSPSDPAPTEYPTGTASVDPTDVSSCTPPPTQSCITYTTKTTIAVVVSGTESYEVIPTEPVEYPTESAEYPTESGAHPTEPAGYPTNDKYAWLKRRQHIKEHAAAAHH
ncbi:endo-1,3(4)-beta-glucanase [Blastomyces parvus]|uniref:endo-1,3(4)-beta-glucanase n=1 Tax=Blastomyces parvus TaxID=2060905 RepID=A0A2B7XDM7_9EURO|nr:endo-1,3(4)-beta-glucanase [Blastomyces parvus]